MRYLINASLCDIVHALLPVCMCMCIELEWMLSEKGALKTSLEEDPRKDRKVRDVLTIGVRQRHRDAEDSDDDSD